MPQSDDGLLDDRLAPSRRLCDRRPMSTEPFIVCLTGAESTGKTTLANALANHYGAKLVPEVARRHLAPHHPYGSEEVLAIARAQMQLEAEALEEGPRLVICDTDLLVIQIWWQVKFGPLPDELAVALAGRAVRSYLLTRPDIPWIADPLRESGGQRSDLHRRYQRALASGPYPYAEIGGDFDARLRAAKKRIDRWLSVHESA